MPNPRESWSISVEKDYLKFSAAHFLIFPDGTAERLHGHNYKVYVDLHTELDEHGLVVNFKEIKPLVRQLCDELDEHLLIPGDEIRIPAGTRHTVRNCGEGPARWLHGYPLAAEREADAAQ